MLDVPIVFAMKSELHIPDETGTYSVVTRGIQVSVVPVHLEKNSAPERGIFAFNYTVAIRNSSQETVQLLERHWVIKSAGRQIAEIVGPGVVGVEPILESNSAFEYSSTVVIHDQYGSMEGSYTFRSETGSFFEVQIPRFDLLYPIMIH